MAYFGRKPKKPGSVPGAASGFAEEASGERRERLVQRFADRSRPGRPARMSKAVRAARGGRSTRGRR